MGVLADWQIEQRVALGSKNPDDLLYPPMQATHQRKTPTTVDTGRGP